MQETRVQFESGRHPGKGNGNPFQYSCLENPMDKGAWWAMVHGVKKLDMTEQLSTSKCLRVKQRIYQEYK